MLRNSKNGVLHNKNRSRTQLQYYIIDMIMHLIIYIHTHTPTHPPEFDKLQELNFSYNSHDFSFMH